MTRQQDASLRALVGAETPRPEVQLLSNGKYHVMVTNAGGGYSHWKNLAVTRWREDATCDNWGAFCYIRDVSSGKVWSTTHQPTLQRADRCEVAFSMGRAEFCRHEHDIETNTEVAVSPDDDVELRRVRLINNSTTRRELDVTSYAEIVLAPPAADAAHSAFSKLFVETEILPERQAILSSRRPRGPGEPAPWMFHLLAASAAKPGEVSFETDRLRFIGRGRTAADPRALDDTAALSGRTGSVLDPVAAIRCCITLDPGQTATVDLISGISETRLACVELAAKYQDRQSADRVLAAAPAHVAEILTRLHASDADGRLYTRLASSLVYANPSLRADPSVLGKNRQGQSRLRTLGIPGDLPIALLRTSGAEHMNLTRQLLQARAYWRLHGLPVDLVIISDDHGVHEPTLREQIAEVVAATGDGDRTTLAGGIFLRDASEISDADRILLNTVARVVIDANDGSLAQQIEARSTPPNSSSPPRAVRVDGANGLPHTSKPDARVERDLLFGNGLGGFTPNGREYVITTSLGHVTPAPWVNILANPSFGTLVSESGSANTWSENAQAFRLTPWSNDSVGDANTEAYYIRDEDTGNYWSPTLQPSGGPSPYVTRHGFGYSAFEHSENGIASELAVYVAIDAPIKFAVLRVRNASGRMRRLSATGYVEWVLGDDRTNTCMHVITTIDAGSGTLFAHNPFNTEFVGRTAFFAAEDVADRSCCGDRGEFLGRNGTLRNPAAMSQSKLSGTVGSALDPCAAIRLPFELTAGTSREFVFLLGAGRSGAEARRLVLQWRGSAAAQDALAEVKQYWRHMLGAVQVETPDRSLDILTNGWLVYQILSCRLWARNAFYQSSGAFGFRDQLQDVMALVHGAPELVREHLLRSAARQFPEGDVQHWWHPPSGRGVRTRCSDDFLWLALATCRYVEVCGDTAVLDEPVHFLEGRALNDAEESYYDVPKESGQVASLYDHCVRAVDHGLRFGAHGLPLMGSGDWNDGMNLVGAGGKGESVWLGFFLHEVLTEFGELARRHGDAPFADRCLDESARLRDAIERSGWDGAWYRRAWFDDGSPLGTSSNTECRIDSIAQSWAVLSGAGNPQRARLAMDSVDAQLVHRDTAVIQLLDPPFDRSAPNPGYIQGYVRGVRENGGQYTHAAVWATMAFAALGDAERAWELFRMIDPVNHTKSADAIAVYKSEPYVLASDVYSLPPHTGRGGWTWYTGAAGWMYRCILESLLGLRIKADQLRFSPCVPAEWSSFRVDYRYKATDYHITAVRTSVPDSTPRLTLDGVDVPGPAIALLDDRRQHVVEVTIGADVSSSNLGHPAK